MKLTAAEFMEYPATVPGLARGQAYTVQAQRDSTEGHVYAAIAGSARPDMETTAAVRLSERREPLQLAPGQRLWVWCSAHWRGSVVVLPIASGDEGGWR